MEGGTDICPLCNQEREDQLHVFTCKNCRAIEKREDSQDELKTQLYKLNTHPDLVTIIIKAIADDQVQLLDTEGHSMHEKLQKILLTQKEIGWRNFRLGFWATAWLEVQTAYAK